MDDALTIPLLACAAGAGLAGLFTVTAAGKRISPRAMGWLLAIAPVVGFGILVAQAPSILAGQTLSWSVAWVPSLGLRFSLLLDGLSLLFALLVSGIGVLVLIYSGYYFTPARDEAGSEGATRNTDARFFFYLLLFMTSMLGLVLAGDAITLFVFWEGTSITSFLLVAYKYKDKEARRGAFRALFITGGGGIALLAGLVFAASIAGSTSFAEILRQGDALRASELYPVLFGLIALGAMTKSAQAPAHFWLPGAMSAPAPASAYLHSATMVKAGVYLLARMHPALGGTDLWFWLLSGVGLATMLIGAYVGFKQNDLKALLAYSTVSQLGVLVMLIGQDTEIAFKALVISILAHALYKSALFLVTGIVDHETGTRDLRELGGIWRAMPATFAIATIAALSMAGLPPLFGFLAKETLLATATHPNVPAIVDVIFPAAAVLAGALILAQAGLIIFESFLGKPKSERHPHEAPVPMWLVPAIPAVISLAIGLLPEPEALATLLARAAAASYGAPVKVSLALWTGINIPLALSVIAIGVGTAILALRSRLRPLFTTLSGALSLAPLYDGALKAIDGLAWLATRVQNGKLRLYLAIMFIATGVMMVTIGRLSIPPLPMAEVGQQPALAALRIFLLLVIAVAALASALLKRDLFAILALAASGLSVAMLMILEPAPDIALVQVVVEALTLVVLVLALTRLPREQRERAFEFTFRQSHPGLVRDVLIALGSGAVMFAIVLTALVTRPRESQLTPFYEQNAKPLTSANDIVGAIIVDFSRLRHVRGDRRLRDSRPGHLHVAALCLAQSRRPRRRQDPAGQGHAPLSRHRQPAHFAICAGAGLADLAAHPGAGHRTHVVWPRPAGGWLHRRGDRQPGRGDVVCRIWLRGDQATPDVAATRRLHRRRLAAGHRVSHRRCAGQRDVLLAGGLRQSAGHRLLAARHVPQHGHAVRTGHLPDRHRQRRADARHARPSCRCRSRDRPTDGRNRHPAPARRSDPRRIQSGWPADNSTTRPT
ncbi:MAG: DUF4040 domain-containing protein [Anaerolineae bacterium]|nr:DUF4040 domain-containing protein [Anaerolineae bacterium]